MRRFIVSILILPLVLTGLMAARPSRAAETLAQKLSGRILLQVEAKGRLWYISPVNTLRYYLKDDPSSFELFRVLSVAMSDANLSLIPLVGSTETGDSAFRLKFSGRIVRQSGTLNMWYVSPLNRQRYALTEQPLAVLRSLSLGISNANLNTIPVAFGFDVPPLPVSPVNGLLRVQKNIATPIGTFLVDLATLDLDHTNLKIMTDTGNGSDCQNNCATFPLKSYTDRRKAVFGIHGTYFCPPEYSTCVGQTGSYFYPVLNSFNRVLINSTRVKYTTQPLVTFDFNNTPTYYSAAKNILGQNLFAPVNLTNIRAAISNSPALIEAGRNVANPAWMDTKQRTVKSSRGAFGWKGRTMYFFIVRGATVVDTAAVARALNLDYALNLDGGGSTAMVQNGSYILGPGRNLPNALLLVP